MLSRKQIPFFNYQALFATQEAELTRAVVDVMRRGAYILQKDLAQFEQDLRDLLGVKYAWGVADGTNALEIALLAAGVRPGDEVIVPSHTYIASAAAIHFIGAIPVPVECGQDHLIDPHSARRAVTARTRALMPVHLNGRTCDMHGIEAIARDHDFQIVEDAAQALGSKFKGRFAGTFGVAGTFSFYPAKVLGCFGDGGGVVTNDDEIGRRLMLLRDHGRNEEGLVVTWGKNCRLDNMQAAILSVKLRSFGQSLERRRVIARRYNEGMKNIDELLLPPAPDSEPDHYDVFQNYEIEANRRDELKAALESDGIRTIIQFGGRAIHQFAGLGFKNVSLPHTERVYERALLLPMNTTLSDDDIEYIIGSVRRFYGYNA